jgi:hydrogenase nickel incorporation protein HypA/HybF
MHELPVTESILNVVLKHASRQNVNKIVAIHLEIGELAELEDKWIQHYFDYFSKGTLAENAKLMIKKTPIILKCETCFHSFEIKKTDLEGGKCPECGKKKLSLTAGKKYHVKNMEVV